MSASVRPRRAVCAAPYALLLAALLIATSAHAEVRGQRAWWQDFTVFIACLAAPCGACAGLSFYVRAQVTPLSKACLTGTPFDARCARWQAYTLARRLLQLPARKAVAGAGDCITDAQCSARCFGGGHIYINSGACSTVCICSASAGQATAVPAAGRSDSSALGSALFTPPSAQQGTFSPGLFSPGSAGGTQASDTTLAASTLDSTLAAATPPPPPDATTPPLGTLAPVATQAPTPVPQTLVQTGSAGGTGSGSLGSTTAGSAAGSTAADGGTGGTLAAASGSGGSGAGGGTAGAAGAGGASASTAGKSSQATTAHGR